MSSSEATTSPIFQRAISNIHPLARTVPDLHARRDVPAGVDDTAPAPAAPPGLELFLALTAVDEAFSSRLENEFRRRSLKYRWMASAEAQLRNMIAAQPGTPTPTTSGKAPASAAEVKAVEAVGKAAADAPVKIEEQEGSANSIMQSIEESPAPPVPGPNARLPASTTLGTTVESVHRDMDDTVSPSALSSRPKVRKAKPNSPLTNGTTAKLSQDQKSNSVHPSKKRKYEVYQTAQADPSSSDMKAESDTTTLSAIGTVVQKYVEESVEKCVKEALREGLTQSVREVLPGILAELSERAMPPRQSLIIQPATRSIPSSLPAGKPETESQVESQTKMIQSLMKMVENLQRDGMHERQNFMNLAVGSRPVGGGLVDQVRAGRVEEIRGGHASGSRYAQRDYATHQYAPGTNSRGQARPMEGRR
ncbi:hypothetical protein N3K66_008888 [Trichothecium roseum]|uniref:Uncharacterized protein n=1 Tax=Trichothecium roseum TaxID=47278 RepID=A0ACC0UST0_9HYPO|nr:hypothetical protein N3K66_008888 [Trichothecium roseum]